MKNKFFKSSFYEKLKFLLIPIGLLIGSVTQSAWATSLTVYIQRSGQTYLYIWNSKNQDTSWGNDNRVMSLVSGTTDVWKYTVELKDDMNGFNCIFFKTAKSGDDNNKVGGNQWVTESGWLFNSDANSHSTGYTEPSLFTVSYNANGGTGSTASHTDQANNSSITLRANGFTRSGYQFAGWNTNSYGTGTTYAAGASYTVTGDVTLHAKWVPTAPSAALLAGNFPELGGGSWNQCKTMAKSTSGTVTTFTYTMYDVSAGDYEFCLKPSDGCGNSDAILKPDQNYAVSQTSTGVTTFNSTGDPNHNFHVETSTAGDVTVTVTYNSSTPSVNVDVTRVNPGAISSGWYLGGSDFGNSWDVSNQSYPLEKKYRGMEGVFYRSGTVTTAAYDCLHNGETRYRPSSNNPVFGGAGWNNKIHLNSVEANSNYRFPSDGTYYIIADTRGDYPYIWYETSEPVASGFHSVNVSGVVDAKGTCKVNLGSTSGFETTKFANGETFYVTITGVSGYIPTITIGGTPNTWWKEQDTYTASGTMSSSDIAVTISYTASRAVTFAKTTGCNSLSATGPSSTAVTTGTKIKDGTSIAFAQTNSTGYTFSKWYSNTSGTSGTQYSTNTSYSLTVSSSAHTIYPLYTENTTTVNLVASPAGKGTFTSGGNTVTSVSAGIDTHPAVTAVPGTGYRVNTSATVWSESSEYISITPTNAATTTITATGTSGNSATLTATFTPNTYTITLKKHNDESDGSISVTYDSNANLTSGVTPPEKTGYTFGGYYTGENGTGTQIIADDGTVNASAGGGSTYTDGSKNWKYANNINIHAKWTAKSYTVTIDKQTSAAGYSAAGNIANQSVTYNAALPSVTGTAPTAATGYKFAGFYTQEGGEGVKLINADKSWVTNVDGYTSADSKWVHDGAITLYAYYQKAEVTIEVTPSVIEPGETVMATPTISPIPEGTTEICWQVQYTSGTPLPTQPEFIQGPDNSIFFSTEDFASATYQVEAKLRVGSTCNAGTVLSTATQTFQVAGRHNVTVQYKCGSEVIQAASTVTAEPLEWTEISAPDIFGYSFSSWTVGDGITLQSSTGTKDNKIKAVYGGILTANYTKDKKIFFKNTLGWDAPFVYFYKDGGYWDENKGAGCDGEACLNRKYAHAMINISGTDIWYFDYSGTGFENQVTRYVAFTWGNRSDHDHFTGVDVVYGTSYSYGYSQGTPMFVPLSKSEQDPDYVNGASYYSKGYWTNYLGQETGYELRIYDSSNNLISSKTQKFTSADKLMAMKATVNLDAGVIYKFEILRNDGMYYGNTGTMNYSNENEDWTLTYNAGKCSIQTAAAGDYTFTLTYSYQDLYIAVDYPSTVGDFRLLYKDQADASYWSSGSAHTAAWGHPSRVVSKVAGAEDIVSFFVVKGASATLQFQHITSINASTGEVSWTDDESAINIDNTYNLETGVYNFYLKQSDPAGTIVIEKVEPYTGDFYIRTKNANNGWDNYIANDHMIMYSNYAETNHNYTHYWMKYVSNGSDIKFCVANDYSPCISDTLSADVSSSPVTTTGGTLSTSEEGVNIRHMWNKNTNTLSRAYLTGPVSNQYLLLRSERTVNPSDNRLFKSWTSAESNTRLNHANFTENATSYDLDTLLFKDNQNWVYQLDVYARPSATYKLTALVNGNTTFLRGLEGNYTTEENIETLIGGDKNSTTAYHVRMIYDFKNDRMVKAWMPSGEVSGELPINADIMIVREHQNAGQQITFANEDSKLSKVHTVYGVMRFNRWTLNNKDKSTHNPVGDPKSRFERGLYWISFPFDVNLSDVFGFGTYGVDWIIEYYDGEGRAASGYWIDSPSFWRYVMPSDRANFVLKAGKGYVLALELDNMKDNNSSFWSNNIEQVELFFPSAEFVSNIKETNVTTTAHTHACSIDRTNGGAYDINQNRTIADSHWNMIGVPSYANYGEELTSDGSTTIEWATPTNSDLPYLYEWNMVDNTYTPQTGTTYPFKSMHSYMVQYHGEMHWALASATPSSVAARRNAEGVQDVEFRMEIQQNEKMIDQTFVRMSNDAEVSASFKFDEDLFKEFNKNKANIYTYIENYIPAAGNILPTSEQTTLVPVGVKVPANGEYTFAIPDGTQGVGVTLIDNGTGARTSLSALEYSIYLTAGDHNERFMLEISPISSMPTEVEALDSQESIDDRTRKVIIDGVMYIIREGKMYDARGARVE